MDDMQPPQNTHVTLHVHKGLVVATVVGLFILTTFTAYLIGRTSVMKEPSPPYPTIALSPTPTVFQFPITTRAPRPTEMVKETPDKPSSIPPAVIQKRQEIRPTYQQSEGVQGLGTGILYCKKGSQTAFVVWGSGGYSGENHFFTDNGSYLGVGRFNDTPPFNTGDFNISEYGCVDITP